MEILSFQLVMPKISISNLSLLSCHNNLSANSDGFTFRIYTNSHYFSLTPLLPTWSNTPPSLTWITALASQMVSLLWPLTPIVYSQHSSQRNPSKQVKSDQVTTLLPISFRGNLQVLKTFCKVLYWFLFLLPVLSSATFLALSVPATLVSFLFFKHVFLTPASVPLH